MTPLRDKVSVVTRSEALQIISDRNECSRLLECELPVTQDYFKRICGTQGYVKCHRSAKCMGELKSPMTWLQRQAIHEATKKTKDPKPQNSIAIK